MDMFYTLYYFDKLLLKMPLIPALPPYAPVMTPEVIQCTVEASNRYGVPELLLHALVLKEDGRPGKCAINTGGKSKDCGIAQINDVSWKSHFERYNISFDNIKNNSCLNINVSAYIIRYYFNLKKDWTKAIISYNIGPNNWDKSPNRLKIGSTYANDVIKYWWKFHNWQTSLAAAAEPQSYEAPPLESTYDYQE